MAYTPATEVTDDEVQRVAGTARPFALLELRWGDRRHQNGADAIERAHQRRMVSLRADGVIAVLYPVASDTLAGVALMTVTVDEARAVIADDPCVQAGMLTAEVFGCVAFPGDRVPGTATEEVSPSAAP